MTSASPETGRTVRVSVVPHRTQAWVTSLRSFDSAPLANRVRVIAVITIWCPQCVQGRRKVGRLEGATSLYCMELFFNYEASRFHSGHSRPDLRECQHVFCAAHIICASRHPSASFGVYLDARPARRPVWVTKGLADHVTCPAGFRPPDHAARRWGSNEISRDNMLPAGKQA
jgi:hypothetical protein